MHSIQVFLHLLHIDVDHLCVQISTYIYANCKNAYFSNYIHSISRLHQSQCYTNYQLNLSVSTLWRIHRWILENFESFLKRKSFKISDFLTPHRSISNLVLREVWFHLIGNTISSFTQFYFSESSWFSICGITRTCICYVLLLFLNFIFIKKHKSLFQYVWCLCCLYWVGLGWLEWYCIVLLLLCCCIFQNHI